LAIDETNAVSSGLKLSPALRAKANTPSTLSKSRLAEDESIIIAISGAMP
jgi:hypothetical protein